MRPYMKNKVICSAVAGLLMTWLTGSYAADIAELKGREAGLVACRLEGELVDLGDVVKMQSMALAGCRMLHLNSHGGSIDVAIALGEIIRKGQMHVIVNRGGECASACVLLFAAGIARFAYGPILVHRPYFEASLSSYKTTQGRMNAAATKMRDYLRLMNVSEALVEKMMAVSPEDARPLTIEEMQSLGLGYFDPVYVETRENSRAVKLGMTKRQFLEKKRTTAAICGRIDVPSSNGAEIGRCWTREFPGYWGE
jgi:hypothetical protein